MRKIILFAAALAAGVLIRIGTWNDAGTITPISALAGSTINPLAMMAGTKDHLPTSRYDDYSVVFVGR